MNAKMETKLETEPKAKLEAQDIRLDYVQPRTNTRLTALV